MDDQMLLQYVSGLEKNFQSEFTFLCITVLKSQTVLPQQIPQYYSATLDLVVA